MIDQKWKRPYHRWKCNILWLSIYYQMMCDFLCKFYFSIDRFIRCVSISTLLPERCRPRKKEPWWSCTPRPCEGGWPRCCRPATWYVSQQCAAMSLPHTAYSYVWHHCSLANDVTAPVGAVDLGGGGEYWAMCQCIVCLVVFHPTIGIVLVLLFRQCSLVFFCFLCVEFGQCLYAVYLAWRMTINWHLLRSS